jgi:hypothetical protein
MWQQHLTEMLMMSICEFVFVFDGKIKHFFPIVIMKNERSCFAFAYV